MTGFKCKFRATIYLQSDNGQDYRALIVGVFDTPMDASCAASREASKHKNVLSIVVKACERE